MVVAWKHEIDDIRLACNGTRSTELPSDVNVFSTIYMIGKSRICIPPDLGSKGSRRCSGGKLGTTLEPATSREVAEKMDHLVIRSSQRRPWVNSQSNIEDDETLAEPGRGQ